MVIDNSCSYRFIAFLALKDERLLYFLYFLFLGILADEMGLGKVSISRVRQIHLVLSVPFTLP
jgi:hypothetical protein